MNNELNIKKTKNTKLKFIDELELKEKSTKEVMYFVIYECFSCSWRFVGNTFKSGNKSESDVPNYCPMCGRSIDENNIEWSG